MNEMIILVGRKGEITAGLGELMKLLVDFKSQSSEGGEKLTVKEVLKLIEVSDLVKKDVTKLCNNLKTLLNESKLKELKQV